ncbi:MAG: DNA-processing protein DprA [Acidimicrobiia bacterium]|nr:DNA-processing protein DprA [Acidimicrobiia bacterium]
MTDDTAVAAAALAGLHAVGPATLRRLLTAWPDPRAAVRAIQSGRAVDALARRDREAVVRRWQRELDLVATETLLRARGTRVFRAREPSFPIDTGLADHPLVLFGEGLRPDALERPRVGVVGTRAATPHGRADAYELGGVLARAGVTVVSGLAIGIDGSAHEGALDASGLAIGVLGTGLDIVYPRRHTSLHERVREHGMLLSENAHGVGPHPSRFPIRNRIIAALSDVLVVVEATETGGARITAQKAYEYGVDVCAYPGSRRNPSARGTNELLRTAHVILDPDDVLAVLGLNPGNRRSPADLTGGAGEPGTLDEQALLQALGGEPATVDELTSRTALGPGPVAVAIAGLIRSGHLRRAHGVYWPR